MRSIETKAKTREEAIALGLEELGVSLADVVIETLDEGKKGVLGILGSRPVVLRLTLKEEENGEDSVMKEIFSEKKPAEKPRAAGDEKPKRSIPQPKKAPAEKPQPAKETQPQKPKEQPAPAKAAQEKPLEAPVVPQPKEAQAGKISLSNEEVEARVRDFLTQITHLMGVDVTIDIKRDEEGNVRVSMFGDTLGILIGRRGETLDALQYLTGLYTNRGLEEYTRVTLDTENYRAKREEALVRLANRMASRAVKTGRKVSLEPMNPYERRILHSALSSHPAVTTHSEGEEPNRHVVITLK